MLYWFDFVVSTVPTDHYDDVIMTTMASQITSLTVVYSSVYSAADQRKHQSSALRAFRAGNSPGPVNSPHKGPVTRKMFPFDDVIMWTGTVRCCNFWGTRDDGVSSRVNMTEGLNLAGLTIQMPDLYIHGRMGPIPTWISKQMLKKCKMQLPIHSQTSLKFGNGWVIAPHTYPC